MIFIVFFPLATFKKVISFKIHNKIKRVINRSIDRPPFLINSPHQSSPFVFFHVAFFFFKSGCTMWLVGCRSLTRDQTQALAMEVLSPNHRTSRECPLCATTDGPTLTHHNHLMATVFTPGGGHSVGLDECMTTDIHHNIKSIFTAPKSSVLYLFISPQSLNPWQPRTFHWLFHNFAFQCQVFILGLH